MIEAKIIADSLGPFGDRIITYVLTFPRIVLAEFNTHRALSRNSASSRAIPFKKMLKMVRENPFIPKAWMKDHTGMQGNEYIDPNETFEFGNIFKFLTERFKIKDKEDPDYEQIVTLLEKIVFNNNFLHGRKTLTEWWLLIRDKVVECATLLFCFGVSKQICNRLLEPFMWHTCICTATEWENFFALRANPDAEIHIQELAYKMLEAANAQIPTKLQPREWHIPFGDRFDIKRIEEVISDEYADDWVLSYDKFIQKYKVMIATARCARVSYFNFEGKDDYREDIKLFNRLLKAGHMSPFEHCAETIPEDAYYGALCDVKFHGGDDGGNAIYDYGWSGNFKGFKQLRWTLPNENKKDERYNRK